MINLLIRILIAILIAANALAHAPLISIESDSGVKSLKSLELSGIQLTPLRKLKAEWDGRHGIDFLSIYQIEVEDKEKVVARYKLPNEIVGGNGLRISIYRVTSEDNKMRTLELLHTEFYKSGTEVRIPVIGKKRNEALYIATAEVSKGDTDIDQNLAYMLQLNVQKKKLIITDIGTNFKMSDVNFIMQTGLDNKFSFALSEGYRRLNNPHWVTIVYPKYK